MCIHVVQDKVPNSDAGLADDYSQSAIFPPYPLMGSSFTIDGFVLSPVLRTSPSGLMAEDAGTYSCVVLDNNFIVRLNSSVEISVLRKLCTVGNVTFAAGSFPEQHILSPRRRGIHGVHQDICTGC